MAERAPPPVDETRILDPNNHNHNNNDNDNDDDNNKEGAISQTPNPEPNPNCFCRPAATYVVQVPKDQIYRVPPPENAAIAERRRPPITDTGHKSNRCKFRLCASRCCCAILFVTVLLLAVALAATLLPAFLDPEDPTFHVERLDLVSDAPRERAYKLAMRSDNPNARVDMSYAQGGVVSLWYRQQEIAVGKFPAFYHAHGSSAAFETVLRERGALPKEIAARQNGTRARVSVTLKMSSLSARTEVWTWNTGSVKLDVACDLTVDSLVPKDSARVLSQECRTK